MSEEKNKNIQGKMIWPKPKKLFNNILIVILFTTIMCLIFWLIDIGLLAMFNKFM